MGKRVSEQVVHLVEIDDRDGSFLESELRRQVTDGVTYPLSEKDTRNYSAHLVRRADKDIKSFCGRPFRYEGVTVLRDEIF